MKDKTVDKDLQQARVCNHMQLHAIKICGHIRVKLQ